MTPETSWLDEGGGTERALVPTQQTSAVTHIWGFPHSTQRPKKNPLFNHHVGATAGATEAIAKGERVKHVLNTTSSMKHRQRWIDYGELSSHYNDSPTTTMVWDQEPARRVPWRLLQMLGKRPHCTPLPGPYPMEPSTSATHNKPFFLSQCNWVDSVEHMDSTWTVTLMAPHAEPWWIWGPPFSWSSFLRHLEIF